MRADALAQAEKEYKAFLDKARAEAEALLKSAEGSVATTGKEKDKALQEAEKKVERDAGRGEEESR